MSNLNGLYTMSDFMKGKVLLERDAGVQWTTFRDKHYSLKFSEMKLKPY